jgi:hypothetical protein
MKWAQHPKSCILKKFKGFRPMFTSWSVAPKCNPEEREFFTSEEHAVDVAFDWSIDEGGAPMIVFCNDQQWMQITA